MNNIGSVNRKRTAKTIVLAAIVIGILLWIASTISSEFGSLFNCLDSSEFKAWLVAPVTKMKIWQAILILWIVMNITSPSYSCKCGEKTEKEGGEPK